MKKRIRGLLMLMLVVCTLLVPAAGARAASASIRLNKTKMSMAEGKSKTLKVTVKGSSRKVTWTSSNKAVAKVSSSGKVTALHAGRTTIKATANGRTAKCVVTVFAKKLRLADFNVTSSLTGITLGSPYLNVHSYLQAGSGTAFYGFHSIQAQQYELPLGKVVQTLRGITLGMAKSDVLLAYGSGTSTSFDKTTDKINLIETQSYGNDYFRGSKALKNARSVLTYTYEKDSSYEIRFYFNGSSKLISVVFTKNYGSFGNYGGWSSY